MNRSRLELMMDKWINKKRPFLSDKNPIVSKPMIKPTVVNDTDKLA